MEGLERSGQSVWVETSGEYLDHVAPVAVVKLVAMLGLFDGSIVCPFPDILMTEALASPVCRHGCS